VNELLLVGVGRMGRPYLDAARRLGLRVRAVEAAARVDAVAARLDSVRACHGHSDEHWVAAAQSAAVAHPPDGVVAFSEPQVLAAALLQETGALPGPSLHAAVLSRNKALQRAVFASHDVRQPEHLVSTDLAADAAWATARLPVVVKPLTGSGSEGVEVVDGSVWFSNVTEKETTGPPYFVEVSHRAGVQLAAGVADQVDELAAGVLAGLRMRTGMVHLEFRLTGLGPSLMEVAVRTPGDFIMDLLCLTYDLDWFELAVRAAMSMPLPTPPSGPVRFAASYLPSVPPGTVALVEGWSEVCAHPCVVDAALLVSEGDVVAPLRSSSQRVGHVLLVADSRADVEAALEEVRTMLTIRVGETSTRPTPEDGLAVVPVL
jgi:biotin carboxylase